LREHMLTLTPKTQGLCGFDLNDNRIIFNDKIAWGFFVSWGLHIHIDTSRTQFITRWKKTGLPTKGIINKDFLELSPNKRWLITADKMRGAFEAQRPDGTQVKLVRLDTKRYKILRIKKRKRDIRTQKNQLIFSPSSKDGPFLFENPDRDQDVAEFVRDTYIHALTHITTDEARRYIVAFLKEYLFAALTTQKGGMYYVDVLHTTYLKRLRTFLKNIGERLGIFPILKTSGKGDIDYFPFLQSLMIYQLRRRFLTKTTNIRRAISSESNIGNHAVQRYDQAIKDIVKGLRYYSRRFGLEDVFDEIKADARLLRKQLKTEYTDIDIRSLT